MTFKKWVLSFFAVLLTALVLLGSVVAVIDPFFHYHAPVDFLQYRIFYERYQNDGIVKHFDYDALITGNSVAENFKTSELDALFGTNAVKVPFSGATLKELDTLNRTAIEHNESIRLVVEALSYSDLILDKDALAYDESDYPNFLYNKNPLDDVKYLFNKSIFKTALDMISYTRAGHTTTSFDAYAWWDTPDTAYGQDAILGIYERGPLLAEQDGLSDYQRTLVRENVTQNILETAQANPQIDFYVYIAPFSMYAWDRFYRAGELKVQLEAEREAVELMLTCDNIYVFSFTDAFDLVQDYDRYKDTVHHDSRVNSWILECMVAGEHMVTYDNREEYFSRVYDFYTSYDYDSLFA